MALRCGHGARPAAPPGPEGAGGWGTGEALPSEPELGRRFGVSRVVVRQALAILEDDRQIVRVKGRGTFVAEPKLDARAGGLSRSLVVPRPADVAIQVLDVRTSRSRSGRSSTPAATRRSCASRRACRCARSR
jgi:DNA-binding transcriptional MocR family regulator